MEKKQMSRQEELDWLQAQAKIIAIGGGAAEEAEGMVDMWSWQMDFPYLGWGEEDKVLLIELVEKEMNRIGETMIEKMSDEDKAFLRDAIIRRKKQVDWLNEQADIILYGGEGTAKELVNFWESQSTDPLPRWFDEYDRNLLVEIVGRILES